MRRLLYCMLLLLCAGCNMSHESATQACKVAYRGALTPSDSALVGDLFPSSWNASCRKFEADRVPNRR